MKMQDSNPRVSFNWDIPRYGPGGSLGCRISTPCYVIEGKVRYKNDLGICFRVAKFVKPEDAEERPANLLDAFSYVVEKINRARDDLIKGDFEVDESTVAMARSCGILETRHDVRE